MCKGGVCVTVLETCLCILRLFVYWGLFVCRVVVCVLGLISV